MVEKETRMVPMEIQEGQLLLKIAAGFGLPANLGDTKYNITERGLAVRDVQTLYADLRDVSPLLSKDRKLLFGPAHAWVQAPTKEDPDRWLVVHNLTLNVPLSEDGRRGAYWCLLMALHPGSPVGMGAGTHMEYIWPLARRLRVSMALEKALGLDESKRPEIQFDPEPSVQK